MLAGSAGPAVGVKAVEITDAVHVVGPPRWSDMTIEPREPDIVLEVVDATCVPREKPTVGALMERVPEVSVNDAGVAPAGGKTNPIVMADSVVRRSANFRNTMETSSLSSKMTSQRFAESLIDIGSEVNPN